MAKITIEITNNNKTIVTYDNGETIYPICECNEYNFNIFENVNNCIINFVSSLIFQLGKTLKYQFNKQMTSNNTLNKPIDGK